MAPSAPLSLKRPDIILTRPVKGSWLKSWAAKLAKRAGMALAGKHPIGVIGWATQCAVVIYRRAVKLWGDDLRGRSVRLFSPLFARRVRIRTSPSTSGPIVVYAVQSANGSSDYEFFPRIGERRQ
jgi:hypothetical protein